MDFSGVVADLAHGASLRDAQEAIRTVHGRGAARWLAEREGISPRTARRWLSKSPPGSRADRIRNAAQAASPVGAAAQRLRGAASSGGGIDVGRAAVDYDGEHQGDREIGWIDIDAAVARDLNAAANALDAGNLAAAADAFSDAVIGGYSPGLEDALSISDYHDGVQLYN